MATPNRLGMQKSYIPNSEADMRFKKKAYQKGREVAERNTWNPKSERRLEKDLKRRKGGAG